jgi:hypothetical protein
MLAGLLGDVLLLTVIVINNNPQQLRLSIPEGFQVFYALSPRLLYRWKYQDCVMSSRFGTGYY